MKNIITYGTFDLFHIGHLNLLKRLSEMGQLTVAVSTDEFNEGKGKKTIIPFEQRIEIVRGCRYVHQAIPESSWEQKINDIQTYHIDTFVIGDDWQGKFDFLQEYCEVVYLPRTEGISTTQLKKALSAFSSINKEEFMRAFEILEMLKADLN
ncbi:adenylyltransferase/cytidyltransferase family protein [Alkalimonas amylolytica]|uniref:Glycerol-3-phosphate cytidylyltransferase n=1 Tax=Alkalimonas amylolytica TaxID=152573 RepID=A0A1H4A206_ALKAM|nr:adenylyltransferase/cytidyltransferase family protein [Alkalimonas amylolytica]SEA30006.1 Glycerol-3-phosphate cytidylyltransferase [Alkalimonas amylolytica]